MFDLFQKKKDLQEKAPREMFPLSFRLGICDGKETYCALSKMPHLLVAGKKEEKHGFLNATLLSFAHDYTEEALQLLLLDSVDGGLSQFASLPQLLVPVEDDVKKQLSHLSWMLIEMKHRYTVFQEAGVRNFNEYNNVIPAEVMPRIVIVVNELAEMTAFSLAEAEESLCRLAQMGRAAGIHLILATAHPAPFVVTGILKANLPSRIAFALQNGEESRAVLDVGGAEKLGEGEMLYLPLGAAKPMRVITCPATDEDVANSLDFLKKKKEKPEVDPLLEKAILLGLERGELSTSLLQRKLEIGYARAARILDLLEEMKAVEPYCGAKPRKVLWTGADFEAYKAY